MAITRAKKEELREVFTNHFNGASSAIVAQYSGLTMAELSELRTALRKSDTNFKVIKNRLVKKSFEVDKVSQVEEILNILKGPVGIAFVKGDPAQAAKTLLDFQKDHPALEVKGGIVDAKKVSAVELEQIASLPSKEELMAKIVGSLVSPHRGLLGVLTGVQRNLVQVINAIKEKKNN